MGDHSDENRDGIADHDQGCEGENRADPDSWDDPDICDAWELPEEVSG